MERRLSRITAAVAPPGDARSDLDIIAMIGNQIQPGLFDEPPLDPEAVFDEMRMLTVGRSLRHLIRSVGRRVRRPLARSRL